jgi:hypothetical protein
VADWLSAQIPQIDILIEKPDAEIWTKQIFKADTAHPTCAHIRRQKTGRQSEPGEGAVQAHIAVSEATGAVEQPRPCGEANTAAKRAVPID